jgi:hypothetical protein
MAGLSVDGAVAGWRVYAHFLDLQKGRSGVPGGLGGRKEAEGGSGLKQWRRMDVQ